MKEELISLETAKLAKEKGYDVPDLFNYDLKGKLCSTSESIQSYYRDEFYLPLKRKARGLGYLAPTQSLLQKWLREEHNIHIAIVVNNIDTKTYEYDIATYGVEKVKGGFTSYEIALEKGLQKALTLI